MNQEQFTEMMQKLGDVATALSNVPGLANVTKGLTDMAKALNDNAAATTAATAAAQAATGAQNNTFHTDPMDAMNNGQEMKYLSKDAKYHYKTATQPLLGEDLFDVEPGNFQAFMNRLSDRADSIGFTKSNGIAIVKVGGKDVNVIADYGAASYDEIATHEKALLTKNDRKTQDSKMLHDLLVNSLSTEGYKRIQVWRDQYIFVLTDSSTPPVERKYYAGLCLLKVIVRESYLDSNATVTQLKLQLGQLHVYIEENGSDIVAFNAHVKAIIDGLSARGESSSDLLPNLFKGYKRVSDKGFRSYITAIENNHDDGTKAIDPSTLMVKAQAYYKKRLTTTESEPWDVDQNSQKIMALEAKIRELSKKREKGPKLDADKPAATPKWKKENVKPSNVNEVKEWMGRKWYWCGHETGGKCGGKWRNHMPQQCRGIPDKRKAEVDDKAEQKRKSKTKKVVEAYNALIDKREDSDGEVESDGSE
ncbi:MAG: hypothetical protein F6J96_34850 [Symploca sp. SIO1C2]|nr:hypothetical protein [Symploca sp. SIO1C2]